MRNLLNVCVANTSYIYDLDESETNKRKIEKESKNKEVDSYKGDIQSDLLESIDQFHNLDTFVDTGTCLTCVLNDEDRNKNDEVGDLPLVQRLISNKKTTMYFMRRKKKHQI